MNGKNIILIGVAIILFFTGNSCNHPETITASDTKLKLPPDSGTIYKLTKHYFILVPGDTALFYGTRNCTVTVNGIITSYINDSVYLRTITLDDTIIEVNDTPYFVHPQLYQQSSSFLKISENTITRFFEKNDTAIIQVLYKDKGILYYPEKNRQIVMPRTIIVGPYGWFETDSTEIPINHKWPSSPLIKTPLISSNGKIWFDGYSVATRPIALEGTGENLYLINGNSYKNGIFIKSYYTISGEIIENSMVVHITGTVTIARAYFATRGLIDQLMITLIQKTFSNGTVEMIKETIYVARGPEGAKQYPDYPENDYP